MGKSMVKQRYNKDDYEDFLMEREWMEEHSPEMVAEIAFLNGEFTGIGQRRKIVRKSMPKRSREKWTKSDVVSPKWFC
jgi:hypothetical protein